MRIALLAPLVSPIPSSREPQPGGSQALVADLAAGLAGRGHEVEVFAASRTHGISALCLSPGAVDTDMLREANPDLRPGLQPQDVAELIVGLLDNSLEPISGANIPLFSNL